jgi:hypothetical protein
MGYLCHIRRILETQTLSENTPLNQNVGVNLTPGAYAGLALPTSFLNMFIEVEILIFCLLLRDKFSILDKQGAISLSAMKCSVTCNYHRYF